MNHHADPGTPRSRSRRRSSRLGAAIAGALVVAAALATAPAAAQSPSEVPTVDVGIPIGLIDGDARAEAAAQGAWTAGEDGCFGARRSGKGAGMDADGGWWLADGALANFGDGVIQAELGAEKKARQMGLLFRANVDAGGAVVGYAVRFAKKEVRIERIDRDGTVELTPWEPLLKHRRKDPVSVSVIAEGELLLVQVNAATGKPLASLIARDDTYAEGRVGLYRRPQTRPIGCAASLTITPTICTEPPTPLPDRPRRFLTVRGELPPALEWIDQRSEGRNVVAADPEQVRQALCDRIDITRVQVETPLKYDHPEFLEARAAALETTERGFVIDRSLKDPWMVGRILDAYHARYPELTRVVELGTTHEDRPIRAILISSDIENAHRKPAILIDSAHHGNEPLSVEFGLHAVQVLLEESDDPEVARWLDELAIWVVPVVNPDGLHGHLHLSRRMGRKNALDFDGDGQRARDEGVDINRNYPVKWGAAGGSKDDENSHKFRGPSAASEPETNAMMGLADSEHFAAALTYHTGTLAVLAGYTIDGMVNPVPNESRTIGKEIAAALGTTDDGQTFPLKDALYKVDGTAVNWYRYSHGSVAFTIEGANVGITDRDKRDARVETVSRSWKHVLRRYVDGPTITGWVVDQHGRPLQARITLDEQTLGEDEAWTSRCRDGHFDKMLDEPGTWTVRASIDDASGTTHSVAQAVTVEAGVHTVTLTIALPDDAPEPNACPEGAAWTVGRADVAPAAFADKLARSAVSSGALLVAAPPEIAAPAPATSPGGRTNTDEKGTSEQGESASEEEATAANEAPEEDAPKEASAGCGCSVRGPTAPVRSALFAALGTIGLLAVRRRRD